MTDLDRKIKQIRRLLQTAHYENYDFIYLLTGDALKIVQLLEDYRRLKGGNKSAEAVRKAPVSKV